MNRLDEIRERERKATNYFSGFCSTLTADDRCFLTHARSDVSWLISEVERLQKEPARSDWDKMADENSNLRTAIDAALRHMNQENELAAYNVLRKALGRKE